MHCNHYCAYHLGLKQINNICKSLIADVFLCTEKPHYPWCMCAALYCCLFDTNGVKQGLNVWYYRPLCETDCLRGCSAKQQRCRYWQLLTFLVIMTVQLIYHTNKETRGRAVRRAVFLITAEVCFYLVDKCSTGAKITFPFTGSLILMLKLYLDRFFFIIQLVMQEV